MNRCISTRMASRVLILGVAGLLVSAGSSLAQSVPESVQHYRTAVEQAQAGHVDAAFDALDKAVQAGYFAAARLDADAAMDALRDDPRYAVVREKMVANHPCNRPECRQFDFWAGKWKVANAQGQQVGTNTIRPILQACALHENWVSAGGGHGESVNFFHPGKQKWVQVWIDGQGGVIEIEGAYADGAMRFTGKNYSANGSYEICRASWTLLEDGRVRQFWEQSRDDGKTWYTWFDGYYSRDEEAGE